MNWKIKHIINFTNDKHWSNGYGQFGFHDTKGNYYLVKHERNWLGQLTKTDDFPWTAGADNPNLSKCHIYFDLKNPMFVMKSSLDETILVSSGGNNKIFKLDPNEEKAEVFIDAEHYGMKTIGNCVMDIGGNIWINEITGCRLWQFDPKGKKKMILGNGYPGFQKGNIKFQNVQFNWIYDIRIGPDNNIYVLDSRNYALRMLDLDNSIVKTIAGTGNPGYSGDGGPAINATFGSNPKEQFDGPWALSLDEEGNIFIGDTHNHVVRMIEPFENTISTILGNPNSIPSKRNSPKERNLFRINLPKICSIDYYKNELFIPEWEGDLIVLEKQVRG
jgi:sugar lactone lactonase YvrE